MTDCLPMTESSSLGLFVFLVLHNPWTAAYHHHALVTGKVGVVGCDRVESYTFQCPNLYRLLSYRSSVDRLGPFV
jgi:hypothetical protein